MPTSMTLDYDADKHEYKINGKHVPSVTQVMEPLDALDGVPAEQLAWARDRGHKVHEACALLLKKNLEWRTLDPELIGYVKAANKFIEDSGIRPLRVESRMGDPDLKFAGTLDCMGVMRRYSCILDWKAVSVMPRTTALQTAAYDYLHRRNLGGRSMKRFGVQLLPNGEYRVWPYEDARDWQWFASALNIWHFRHATTRRLLPAEGWKFE